MAINHREKSILQSRILVVDDEPVNTALLVQILEDAGYTRIHSTTDPREVVPLHRENQYDLILLDIRMPHMSGLQVMETLTRYQQDDYLPVIVLTAQIDDDTRLQALSGGARDFLPKPFKHWEVLMRIHNMLEARLFFKQQQIRADELEQRVQERTRELRETQLEIIRRLGRAAEYRDNETGAHVLRMSKSCQLLALAAGLDVKHAELILFATPMHDIGKIGIPDAILLKQGPLDGDERKIMNTHVELGAKIIGEHHSVLLKMAHSIAFCHHEKWDGSGYPRGLKGEDIPIESRITTICDVFDALTSERPYKKAWPLEQAVTYLQDQAGKHFDPHLIEHFLKILPEVQKLRQELPDEEVLPTSSS